MVESGIEPSAVSPGSGTTRESGIRQYARVLRERWLIVAITVVAAVVAAQLYVSSTTPVYQAQANLLISPANDPNLNALSLFRSSNDPTRDTQTASLLIDTPSAAGQAAHLLKTSESPQALLLSVQVAPVAGSDVIAVTASAPTPARAARLANAFAQAAIDVLTLRLQAQLQTAIPRLEAQVAQLPRSGSGTTSGSLASQLAALRALQGAPDPTISLESAATAPSAPVSPRRKLSLLAGGILGLVLGIAMALVADALDPRLRRESQLQGVLDLPVLARVPWLPKRDRTRSRPDGHELKSLLTSHEFLADALGTFDVDGADKRTIVFTAAHLDAGCTTTAVHHAWLVAAAGKRVVLLDGDPRDPAVGSATGAKPSPQLGKVLGGSRPIEDALVPVEAGGVVLRVLAVHDQLEVGLQARMPIGGAMIGELLPDADVLVVDAPPLTQSARALTLARSVDHVVVVARIGVTRLSELRELGELLVSHGLPSAGIVLVGGSIAAEQRGRERALAWLQTVSGAGRSNGSGAGHDGRPAPGADGNPQPALTAGPRPGRRGEPPEA